MQQGKCRVGGKGDDTSGSYSGGDNVDVYACRELCNQDAECVSFHLYTYGYSAGQGACWLQTSPGQAGNGQWEAQCYVKITGSDGDSDVKQCAEEGGTCKCKGLVYYGVLEIGDQGPASFEDMLAVNKYAVLSSKKKIGCNNEKFGDPHPTKRK